MGFYFIDSTARAAWAASTTQLGQLEGLAALWSANLSARFYSSAGAHLVTVTYGPWVVDMTTTPYSLYPGAWAAESHVQDGTAAYVVLAVPSGSDILRADVSLSGAISDPGGRVRVDIGTTLRIQATASLPGADPYQIAPDGLWTWFTSPVVQFYNGATYVGTIKANGRPSVTKYTHASSSAASFELSTTTELDDHDNPAVLIRQDGKVACLYSIHTENGFRWRISSSTESVSAFDAQQSAWPSNPNPNSYSNLLYLSTPGRYYNMYREGQSKRRAVDTTDWTSWSSPRTWVQSGVLADKNAYTKHVTNGSNRVDFVFTDMAPNSSGTVGLPSSVFHGYMTVAEDGTESFFNSSGSSAGAQLTNTSATKIIDYTDSRGNFWVWDITYGAGGGPQVLMVGFADHADHVYVHGRWNGSAWVNTTITTAGPGLYAGNDFYSGGMCFDATDATRVYLSKKVGSAWEMQEWRTTDNGATWAKHRDITSGSASGTKNCRPMSPSGHDGRAAVVWWRSTAYTDFYDLSNSVIMAVAAA